MKIYGVILSPNCMVTSKFLLRCFFTSFLEENKCKINHVFRKFCILVHLHFGGNKIYVKFTILALTSFIKTFFVVLYMFTFQVGILVKTSSRSFNTPVFP